MQNGTIVDEILAHVPEINFSVSYDDEAVSLFETTIRYLGGMLSAYDLLKGPSSGLVSNVSTKTCSGFKECIDTKRTNLNPEHSSRCTA